MKKHLKNTITIIIAGIILLVFNFCRHRDLPKYKILKVNSSGEFYLDFNKNNKIDDNELVKLYDINTFPSENNHATYTLSKTLKLTPAQITAVGILADEYAQKTFENKYVQVKFFDIEENKDNNFSRAKIYLNGKDIALTLLNQGFAAPYRKEKEYKKGLNFVNLHKNLEKAKNEQIIIFNPKNNIYHNIDCKHAQNIKGAKALRAANLNTDAIPCHKCILGEEENDSKQTKNEKAVTAKNFTIKNFNFTLGNLSFYFTDFNKRLTPDNNCQNAGCKALLNQINNTKESIDFAIYGIAAQPQIINALLAAQSRGVKIRWVTDADTKGQNIYDEILKIQKQLPNFKTDNHFVTLNGKQIKDPKYTNAIMHNKFFIFDKKSVWLGSANVSQTDLADFNANIIIFANSKQLANIYYQEFEQMYNEKFHNLKKQIPNKENLKIDSENTVSVYFSPTDKIITTKLIPLINKAQKYVYISSFIITHKGIESALISAKERGVEIKIIIDATSAAGKYTIHNELRKYNIPVKVENKAGKMHTKSLVIDDKIAIIGSMNLTKSGENKNDENVLFIYNTNIAKTFKSHFLYLWDSIPQKWLTKNPRAEGPESIGSCNDGIDNDFDGFIDKEDPGCKFSK